MPSVKKGENRKQYVKRCRKYLMLKEGIKDPDHATAKCHGLYDQYLKKKKK
jgi:hypothetical protein